MFLPRHRCARPAPAPRWSAFRRRRLRPTFSGALRRCWRRNNVFKCINSNGKRSRTAEPSVASSRSALRSRPRRRPRTPCSQRSPYLRRPGACGWPNQSGEKGGVARSGAAERPGPRRVCTPCCLGRTWSSCAVLSSESAPNDTSRMKLLLSACDSGASEMTGPRARAQNRPLRTKGAHTACTCDAGPGLALGHAQLHVRAHRLNLCVKEESSVDERRRARARAQREAAAGHTLRATDL